MPANNSINNTPTTKNTQDKDTFVKDDDKLKVLEERYKNFSNRYPQLAIQAKFMKAPNKFLSKITNRFIPPISPVEMYKNGELTYEEANDAINKLEKRNAIAVNLGANIVASLAATSAGLIVKSKVPKKAMYPIVIGAGALIGAIVRPAFKIATRMLNKVDGDAFDKAEIKKDLMSGAINGALGGLNASFGKDFSAKNIFSKIGFEFGKQGLMVGADKILLNQKIEDNKEN